MSDEPRPRGYNSLAAAKAAIIKAEMAKRAAARAQFAVRRKPITMVI